MAFKVCNQGSKQPYLLQKMGFVDSISQTTVNRVVYSVPNKYRFFTVKDNECDAYSISPM